MKSISKMLIVIAVLLSTTIYAQITKAEIVATGLTCSMCSNAINKQLKKLPEVDKVAVDLETNTFTVYFKNNTKATPKILKDRIEDAGFSVGSMIITLENNQTGKSYIFVSDKKSNRFKVLDKGYVLKKDLKKYKDLYTKIATYDTDNETDFHLKAL